MKKKHTVDTSAFKKINSEVNSKIAGAIADFNLEVLQNLSKKLLNDYKICMNTFDRDDYMKVVGEISMFLAFAKEIKAYPDSVTEKDVEAKLEEMIEDIAV